jgi:glutathione S-transferase
MKLIGSLTSPFTRKVRIVLAEKKIEYELTQDNPWNAENKVQSFNPLGQVPALVLDDGTSLYDSRVIVEFLDNVSPLSRLIPAGNRERIEVRRWEALADGILSAGILVRMENQRKTSQRDPNWITHQMKKIHAGVAAMEADLGERPWFAGNAYSLADIAVGACLGWLDFRFPHYAWRDNHPNLVRATAKLAERPSFADSVPREEPR